MYLVLAVLAAFVGAIPLVFRKKIGDAIVQGVITAIVGYALLYLNAPSTVWPFFGFAGFLVVIWWTLAAIIDSAKENDSSILLALPVIALGIYMFSAILGSGMFNAERYSQMIGSVEEKTWNQEVQPKDPAHMRMSTRENAVYQAKKALGAGGAIGSQFEVNEANMTLQMINKELWYVAPLDFVDLTTWMNSNGSPGYIKVHGEDPHRQPELVMFKEGERMQYTPGAFFGHELERHLRNNGYLNKGLTDWTFEIDEENHPWWVVTVFEPTIIWNGEKVLGVAIVNPTSGESTFYPTDKIPAWVDRAVPSSFVKNYLTWQGEYSGGWVNSWWGTKNLTEPEEPMLVYGSDGQPEWVTGITSTNGKDDSLIALIYTNSRTGKSVRYDMSGGGTDTAILEAVDKNQQVQYKHLHGTDPQIYNVYGVPTSVVPLLNENHAYQGVAMVQIKDVQTVAVGADQYEALRNYEKVVAEGGVRVAMDKERDLQTIEGVVDRFNSEVTSNGSIYYLHLSGTAHLFTAGAGQSSKLPVTKEGDKVRIEFYNSDRDVVPMHKFDNLSLTLSQSKTQKTVEQKVNERRNEQEQKENAATTIEEIKKLTPEELQELKSKLPKKNKK